MATRNFRAAALPLLFGGFMAAAVTALPLALCGGDAPVKPEKPAVPATPEPAAPTATTPAPATVPIATGSTQVPPLTRNINGADVWTYTNDAKLREPFSYSRLSKIQLQQSPNPGGEGPKAPPPGKQFVEGMPRDYSIALGQFTAAMEALGRSDVKSREANLESAKSQLNGCLANLDALRAQAAKFEKSSMEPADKKQFEYFYAAANRLQRAARQQYDWVSLQIRFSAEVLKKPKYAIAAIQAHRENPTWPYSAVLFEGLKDPIKVGEIFPKQVGPTPPELEMKLLSLTPTTVTVLFQHQATFEIPVNPDDPGIGSLPPAGKK